MLKLLIADCNEDFRLALAEALRGHYHVLCSHSGKEALHTLLTEKPDVLVLDLMLPELDGITLLENAVAEGVRPKVLVATALLTDYVLGSAQRLGIGYAMRKPCDIQAAVARIHDLGQPLNPPVRKQDPRSQVSQLLLSLSLSTKHNGYGYLTEAILMYARNPEQAITKVLYPEVAKIFGRNKGHVERSIRSALEAAWDHGDPAVWRQYFPGAQCRPSNAVFISRMAEALRREMA